MTQWIIIHLICTSARSIFNRFCNFDFNRDKQKVVKTQYSICTMQIHLSFPLKLHYIPIPIISYLTLDVHIEKKAVYSFLLRKKKY